MEKSPTEARDSGAGTWSCRRIPLTGTHWMLMAELAFHSEAKSKLSLQEQLLNYLQSSKRMYSFFFPPVTFFRFPCKLLRKGHASC